jgi:ABC-type molybdate transport system substrate-binding protein
MSGPMTLGRRQLLTGIPLAALASPARAAGDLAVACDTTLASTLGKLGAAYAATSGVRVHVFPTGPGLIVPQLVRDSQNNIVVTQIAILDQAVQSGIVAPRTGGMTWRNPLVIAGLRGAAAAVDQAFAASDPSPASDMDGPALLARLGLRPTRVLGAVDTDEVAFLLTTGAAQAGLLHMTDVRADQRLGVIREVPVDVHPPLVYAASATRLVRQIAPSDFIAFLATPRAYALLTEAGLEVQT